MPVFHLLVDKMDDGSVFLLFFKIYLFIWVLVHILAETVFFFCFFFTLPDIREIHHVVFLKDLLPYVHQPVHWKTKAYLILNQ